MKNKFQLLYISDTEPSNSDSDTNEKSKINTIRYIIKEDLIKEDLKKEDLIKEDLKKEDLIKEDLIKEDLKNNEFEEYDSENDNGKNNYNKDFIDPVILDNIHLYYYFDKNDILYVEKYKKSHLKITDKGLYSITKPLDAQWISEQILKEFNGLKINTIIDGTAGVGGNVISFAKYFKNVIGIELNKIHYQVLKENIGLLDLKNVQLHNDNILTYYEYIEECDKSIFFIDPPWGGRKYKNFKNFVLKLGKYYIYEFIELLYKNGFKYIVLKAPLNLNVNLIIQNITFKNIKVIKHINMMLLVIS